MLNAECPGRVSMGSALKEIFPSARLQGDWLSWFVGDSGRSTGLGTFLFRIGTVPDKLGGVGYSSVLFSAMIPLY